MLDAPKVAEQDCHHNARPHDPLCPTRDQRVGEDGADFGDALHCLCHHRESLKRTER